MKRIDIKNYIGRKENMLTIIKELPIRVYSNGKKVSMVECKCDCGKTKPMILLSIIRKRNPLKSCGCLFRDGLSYHPLYKTYSSIIQRCCNPNDNRYVKYGGAGIRICEEWRNSFLSFYTWAISNGWKKGLEFDRFPDNNGDYSPSNCRIVTSKENTRNRNITVKIEIDGIVRPLAEWAELYNINYHTFKDRYNKGISGSVLLAPIDKSKSHNKKNTDV